MSWGRPLPISKHRFRSIDSRLPFMELRNLRRTRILHFPSQALCRYALPVIRYPLLAAFFSLLVLRCSLLVNRYSALKTHHSAAKR